MTIDTGGGVAVTVGGGVDEPPRVASRPAVSPPATAIPPMIHHFFFDPFFALCESIANCLVELVCVINAVAFWLPMLAVTLILN